MNLQSCKQSSLYISWSIRMHILSLKLVVQHHWIPRYPVCTICINFLRLCFGFSDTTLANASHNFFKTLKWKLPVGTWQNARVGYRFDILIIRTATIPKRITELPRPAWSYLEQCGVGYSWVPEQYYFLKNIFHLWKAHTCPISV